MLALRALPRLAKRGPVPSALRHLCRKMAPGHWATHGQRTFREERAIPPMKVSGGSLDLIRPVKQSKLVQVGLFQQHCISPSNVLSLAVTGARNETWQAVGELLADSTEAQTITRAGKRWTQSRSKVPVVDCLFQWELSQPFSSSLGSVSKMQGSPCPFGMI